jgi:hypothetical protein
MVGSGGGWWEVRGFRLAGLELRMSKTRERFRSAVVQQTLGRSTREQAPRRAFQKDWGFHWPRSKLSASGRSSWRIVALFRMGPHPCVSPSNPWLLRHAYKNHAPLKKVEHRDNDDQSSKAPQDDSEYSAPLVPSAPIKRLILLGRETWPRHLFQIAILPPFLTIVAHTSSLDLGSLHFSNHKRNGVGSYTPLRKGLLVFHQRWEPRDGSLVGLFMTSACTEVRNFSSGFHLRSYLLSENTEKAFMDSLDGVPLDEARDRFHGKCELPKNPAVLIPAMKQRIAREEQFPRFR